MMDKIRILYATDIYDELCEREMSAEYGNKQFIAVEDVERYVKKKSEYLEWLIHLIKRAAIQDNKNELLSEMEDSIVLRIEAMKPPITETRKGES